MRCWSWLLLRLIGKRVHPSAADAQLNSHRYAGEIKLCFLTYHCLMIRDMHGCNVHVCPLYFYVQNFQLFGGYLVNLNSIFVGIRWLQWVSLFKYSFNVSPSVALTTNLMAGFIKQLLH